MIYIKGPACAKTATLVSFFQIYFHSCRPVNYFNIKVEMRCLSLCYHSEYLPGDFYVKRCQSVSVFNSEATMCTCEGFGFYGVFSYYAVSGTM